jgi:hypothetical protein
MLDLLSRLSAIRSERPRAGGEVTTTTPVCADPHTYEPEDPLALEARSRGLDIDDVVERAAIMEYDGGLPRRVAELYALGDLNLSDDELRRMSERA